MNMSNIIVMIPFCRTPDECKLVIDIMKSHGLERGVNGMQIYLMCEIPSNVIEADKFSEYIDGVSIGGNDLLNVYENNDTNDTNLFDMIWNLYKSTILNLSRITQCNIILTDIYYITDSNYARYIPIIEKWNANLYTFANNHNFKVFKISKLLTKPEDFTNGIEPSIIGGTKMVNSFIY